VAVIPTDKNNDFSGTVSILPITLQSLKATYPFEVFIPQGTANLPKDSKIKADQIRTLDKSRLIKFIGALEEKAMETIERALKVHLSLK
jgi:mRNA interferase MazF